MASACPRGETRSSATGIETVSGSPAAVLASQDVAQTHPLPASRASRADRRPRPGPARPGPGLLLGAEGGGAGCARSLRPVTLPVSLHGQRWPAVLRPERPSRSFQREEGLGPRSAKRQKRFGLRHSLCPYRPHAYGLGLSRFGLGSAVTPSLFMEFIYS